jgi:chromosome segregation protein
VSSAEARLAELKGEESRQREGLAQHEKAEAEAREALETERAALAQLEAEREWKARRAQDAAADLARAREAREQAVRASETLRSQVEQERGALASSARRLEDAVRIEIGDDAMQWTTRLALIEQSGREAQARVADSQGLLARARQALDERRSRLAAVDDERRALELGLGELRERESQLSKTIEETQALITPAETQLDASEAELNRLEQTEAEARLHLHSSEHTYTQAQVELARRQEELEGLRRRIEDDFGLVEFEYANEVTGPTPLPISELVQKLPRVEELAPDVEELVTRRRAQMRRMGAVNPEAPQEYREVKERYEFLTEQVSDLSTAETQLRQVIGELDQMMQDAFRKTFEAVAADPGLQQLFGGGTAAAAHRRTTSTTPASRSGASARAARSRWHCSLAASGVSRRWRSSLRCCAWRPRRSACSTKWTRCSTNRTSAASAKCSPNSAATRNSSSSLTTATPCRPRRSSTALAWARTRPAR